MSYTTGVKRNESSTTKILRCYDFIKIEMFLGREPKNTSESRYDLPFFPPILGGHRLLLPFRVSPEMLNYTVYKN